MACRARAVARRDNTEGARLLFFINNGTDAVEGAIKLARLHTKRNTFLSTLGGFHGKSMGSLSLMGKASFREPFSGGLQDVRFALYGDALALEDELVKAKAVGTPIAAFVVAMVRFNDATRSLRLDKKDATG